jgi:hypothetical protein
LLEIVALEGLRLAHVVAILSIGGEVRFFSIPSSSDTAVVR